MLCERAIRTAKLTFAATWRMPRAWSGGALQERRKFAIFAGNACMPRRSCSIFLKEMPLVTARPMVAARPLVTAQPMVTARPLVTAQPLVTARPMVAAREKPYDDEKTAFLFAGALRRGDGGGRPGAGAGVAGGADARCPAAADCRDDR